MIFDYGTITLFGIPFQGILSNHQFCNSRKIFFRKENFARLSLINCIFFKKIRSRLLPFSLAATKGINICFLFLWVLRCFTSPGMPSRHSTGLIRFISELGFPIRKSPDQRLLDTSPRLIAVTPRPSSPQSPEASTICP